MKKQITLQDLFNKMDENFDRLWAVRIKTI